MNLDKCKQTPDYPHPVEACQSWAHPANHYNLAGYSIWQISCRSTYIYMRKIIVLSQKGQIYQILQLPNIVDLQYIMHGLPHGLGPTQHTEKNIRGLLDITRKNLWPLYDWHDLRHRLLFMTGGVESNDFLQKMFLRPTQHAEKNIPGLLDITRKNL